MHAAALCMPGTSGCSFFTTIHVGKGAVCKLAVILGWTVSRRAGMGERGNPGKGYPGTGFSKFLDSTVNSDTSLQNYNDVILIL